MRGDLTDEESAELSDYANANSNETLWKEMRNDPKYSYIMKDVETDAEFKAREQQYIDRMKELWVGWGEDINVFSIKKANDRYDAISNKQNKKSNRMIKLIFLSLFASGVIFSSFDIGFEKTFALVGVVLSFWGIFHLFK